MLSSVCIPYVYQQVGVMLLLISGAAFKEGVCDVIGWFPLLDVNKVGLTVGGSDEQK